MESRQKEEINEPRKKKLKMNTENPELLSDFQNVILDKWKEMINYLERNGENLLSVINSAEDKDYKEGSSANILHLSIKGKNTGILELTLKKNLPTQDKNGLDFPLHEAIMKNDLTLTNKLVEDGAPLDSICRYGLTPLFHAVEHGNFEVIKLLFRKGASFEGKSKDGLPLLHFALEQRDSDKELIRVLLRCGASLSTRNRGDLTPLHYFISKSNFIWTLPSQGGQLKVLLKYGSDVNAWSSKLKETVLHTAIKNTNRDAVILLLEYGADINIKNGNNKTTVQLYVDIAKTDKAAELISFLFFIRKIVALEMAGKYIDPENVYLVLNSKLSIYHPLIIDELISQNVEGVKFLDILVATEDKLMTYARNPAIGSFVRSDYIKDILKLKIKTGKERIVLIEKCEEPFKRVLKWDSPSLVLDKIFSFLSRTDLRSLYAACHPESFFEKVIPKNAIDYGSDTTSDSEEIYRSYSYEDIEDNISDESF